MTLSTCIFEMKYCFSFHRLLGLNLTNLTNLIFVSFFLFPVTDNSWTSSYLTDITAYKCMLDCVCLCIYTHSLSLNLSLSKSGWCFSLKRKLGKQRDNYMN